MLEEIKVPKSQVASRLIKKKRRRRKLYYTTSKERSRAKMRGARVLSRGKQSYGETSKALDFGDQEVDDIASDGSLCLGQIIEEPMLVVGRDEGNKDGEKDDESEDESNNERNDENEELNQSRQDLVNISYYVIN